MLGNSLSSSNGSLGVLARLNIWGVSYQNAKNIEKPEVQKSLPIQSHQVQSCQTSINKLQMSTARWENSSLRPRQSGGKKTSESPPTSNCVRATSRSCTTHARTASNKCAEKKSGHRYALRSTVTVADHGHCHSVHSVKPVVPPKASPLAFRTLRKR